jgi:hypothetical protein
MWPQLNGQVCALQLKGVTHHVGENFSSVQFTNVGVFFECAIDDCASFDHVRRARHVGKDSTRLQGHKRTCEQLRLKTSQRGYILRSSPPTRFRTTSKCSESRARRIHEDSIVSVWMRSANFSTITHADLNVWKPPHCVSDKVSAMCGTFIRKNRHPRAL